MFRSTLMIFAGVAFASAPVSAGPIDWTYSSEFGAADAGTNRVFLGDIYQPDSGEPSGFRHGTVYGIPQTAPNGGPQTGSSRVSVGLLGNGDVGIQWDSITTSLAVSQQFRATVTVTDSASSDSAVFTIFGTGAVSGDPTQSNFATSLSLIGGVDRDATIGGKNYHLRFGTETTETATWLVADVTPAGAIGTPEPATLVMAGVGLAGVAGVRARRRLA